MSNPAPQNSSLDEFLVIVNARDLNGPYVVPKTDVEASLTQEIERRTGLKGQNLAGNKVVKDKKWVSAKPGQFIVETRIAVDGLCKLLAREGATSFEIVFHNTQIDQNWGDRVLLAVRYERGALSAAATGG